MTRQSDFSLTSVTQFFLSTGWFQGLIKANVTRDILFHANQINTYT